jgi:bacillithiol biosynthesis deacetylase BshB1
VNADALVLAAHPDDAEIHCGGTILKLVAAGRRVVLADMTRGEKGTRGTAELRAAECAAATAMLGVAARENLALPDTALRDDDAALAAVLGAIRRHRPRLMFAPWPKDLHPDHEATGKVARRAWFHAGLRNVHPELGEPFRPGMLLFYPSHDAVEPTLCVDITDHVDAKQQVIACYASQIAASQRTHLVRGLDPMERALAADRFHGSRVGCKAAEPFVHDGPLRVTDLGLLLPLGS